MTAHHTGKNDARSPSQLASVCISHVSESSFNSSSLPIGFFQRLIDLKGIVHANNDNSVFIEPFDVQNVFRNRNLCYAIVVQHEQRLCARK